jgi:hypothetical protein
VIVHTDPARVKTARIARAKTPARAPAGRMRFYGTLTGLLIASVAAVGIGASLDSPRSLMTRHDYTEARKAIDAETRQALSQCRALEADQRATCRTIARADDRVRKADLEARYRGTVDAESDLQAAKARRETISYLKL